MRPLREHHRQCLSVQSQLFQDWIAVRRWSSRYADLSVLRQLISRVRATRAASACQNALLTNMHTWHRYGCPVDSYRTGGQCDGTMHVNTQTCAPCRSSCPNGQNLGPRCDGSTSEDRECRDVDISTSSHRVWIGERVDQQVSKGTAIFILTTNHLFGN